VLTDDGPYEVRKLGGERSSGLVAVLVGVPGISANVGDQERSRFRGSLTVWRWRWTSAVRSGIDAHLRQDASSMK
jgi:hypothetical protein